jgi:hypothetical protein
MTSLSRVLRAAFRLPMDFNQHRIIDVLCAKRRRYRVYIGREAIRGDLDALRKSLF